MLRTKHVRILMHTTNSLRVKNMLKWLNQTTNGGSGIFWFTSTENISLEKPATILEDIWTVGQVNHLTEKHSLLDI